jgi:hypothetical protein
MDMGGGHDMDMSGMDMGGPVGHACKVLKDHFALS